MAVVTLRPVRDRRVILEDGSELTEPRAVVACRFTRMLVAMGDAELVEDAAPAKPAAKGSGSSASSSTSLMQGG